MEANYIKLLPIDNRLFKTSNGVWRAKVINIPGLKNGTVDYRLKLDGIYPRLLNISISEDKFKSGKLDELMMEVEDAISAWLDAEMVKGDLILT